MSNIKVIEKLKDDPLMPLRHTAEHILHMSMQELYPQLKKVMGPPIEDGFYFDFDLEEKITPEDFEKIEKLMQEIVNLDLPVTRLEVTLEEAMDIFKDNEYKLQWLDEITDRSEKISIYEIGSPSGEHYDRDLCAGPHVNSTGAVKSFKLLSIAGAYWKGDEKNKMLQRIYATAFDSDEKLEKYLQNLEEAKRRDHRKLGKELDLFTFSELIGSGFPLYTPKGALIRRLVNEYVEEIQSAHGYQQVWTPQVAKADLFKISGHYDKYKDDMFEVRSHYSKEEFYLKPMNCPQHTQIYASKQRSYRDLPLRMTDFAMLYRDEKPGELNGLARVRAFSQDDCHVFCTEDQVDAEIDMALNMIKDIMNTFGFKYRYRLSTRDPEHPEKFLGDPKMWDKVEKWAEVIMERNNIEYFPGVGEAAFYAPKMDLMATDALGREWQLSTIQIDYVMPERFGLEYIDKDGEIKRPVMLHRAIIGSPERFMMILIEHFAGAFPVWLSPVQAQLIPISDKHVPYAESVLENLKEVGIRAELNSKTDTMQAKIRDAQLEKIPYMLIVGDREAEKGEVSLRLRTGEDLKSKPLPEVIEGINKIRLTKSLDLW
ncbi:threonine--tRNA ligase [candidate division WWE3 bacterium]|jgi:threonyl-tRNA synthetase|uniref:Threonine--tRNA ligase n=1 Tax=candidate division WWE3 bacterium TaxID=2053526 RepID=A0A3A4ZLH2_UNCKA|nr:MAG: threonine--tRNA ligase [candidate division WWE3 bacterium]